MPTPNNDIQLMSCSMRVTSHHWPLIAGLTLVFWPGMWKLPCVNAWQAREGAASGEAMDGPSSGAVPRWTSGAPANHAFFEGAADSDEVRQTAWNASTQGQPSNQQANSNRAPAGNARAMPPGSRMPSYRGYNLKMPNTLFSRAAAQPPTAPAVAAAGPRGGSRGANRTTIAGKISGPAGGATRSFAGPRPVGAGQSMPVAGRNLAGHLSDQPVAGAVAATSAGPAEGGPISASALGKDRTLASAAAPGEVPPADRLLLAAHEAAGTAATELELSRVIETCRRARASRPSPEVAQYANNLAAWAMNRRGQLRAEAGRTRDAALDFDEAVRLDPNCWRALHNRGVIMAQAGQFEKAFDDFNRTIEINPEFAKAYSNRAALYVVAGDLLPALEDYTRAIEIDADLSVAHRGRGRVCHLLGRLDEAIAHYDAAVQLAPEDGYAVACRADLMTDLGRYAEAAGEYERAVEIDPNSAHALRGSAWLLATCPDDGVRNPELALERAVTAIRLAGQDDTVAIDTLAAAQASGGDFAAATKTLGQAIEQAPEIEREVYEDRLLLYQQGMAFRIAPIHSVTQAGFYSR
jgi:tetratricopeptide (TPR) repeat protein